MSDSVHTPEYVTRRELAEWREEALRNLDGDRGEVPEIHLQNRRILRLIDLAESMILRRQYAIESTAELHDSWLRQMLAKDQIIADLKAQIDG